MQRTTKLCSPCNTVLACCKTDSIPPSLLFSPCSCFSTQQRQFLQPLLESCFSHHISSPLLSSELTKCIDLTSDGEPSWLPRVSHPALLLIHLEKKIHPLFYMHIEFLVLCNAKITSWCAVTSLLIQSILFVHSKMPHLGWISSCRFETPPHFGSFTSFIASAELAVSFCL